MNTNDNNLVPLTKAELARTLGVSRTYITYITQGKKKPSPAMADRLASMGLSANLSEYKPRNMNQCDGQNTPNCEHTIPNQGVTG